MADHNVSLEIPTEIEVGKADLKIGVKKNGKQFGTLTISKGKIDWRPAKAWRGKAREIRLSWTKFDRAMKEANPNG